ncbi:DUF2516 family protein [Demequina capsici]|uniref:DUF2516 family protein n=1 Tax=Demequina capsici TaxID=3075620 RepID=A0AA96FBB9_9MICO|nr:MULTISPECIES: DUF2516 family protein [unclassified Demequina]WNM24286.1 DUF2516 family protein [Demequina sp. OYTSA14]WNM27114.1 DUF2516 family protein [Demequina sp. PMTSA13]
MFSSLQNLVILVLSVAALVGSVWGLIDAAKYSNEAYVAAGKQTKTIWLVILGVAALIAFISMPYPLGGGGGIVGFLGLLSIVAVIVYFVEVRVKVAPHHRPGAGPKRGTW